jgi:hypothetical protein
VLAAGLLTAVALIALGQPASASTGSANGPAAVDAARPRVAKDADEARHRVPNPLLKEVLGEEDEGEDDPNLSALCQDFVTKPNPYRNPAPNVDQIVGYTTVTVGSQAGCSSAQNETAPTTTASSSSGSSATTAPAGRTRASTAARPGRTRCCPG